MLGDIDKYRKCHKPDTNAPRKDAPDKYGKLTDALVAYRPYDPDARKKSQNCHHKQYYREDK